ncbi:hypothetical protein HYH03_016963 [Edaphochlamys debaryana]|uniref:Uncharacterized protein n=1 Tax=Edaphochlamys debaryana TaxID=47281 RepID=A0A836BR31_9CHLO|nr:hypothetical protein HYH03_016963 [Edaphochlamys debaryana]|eukprot:KAG2484228.1 hypothetical protein HYH03_016963 [Edaphochlamys debaryana]
MRRSLPAAAEAAVLTIFVLLLTPHTAVVRAQVLDMATDPASNATAPAVAGSTPAPAAAAMAQSGGSVIDALAAAGGNVASVVDQFKAASDPATEAALAAAAKVPDPIKTGVNETAVAEFLATFHQNFGTGANLAALKGFRESSSIAAAYAQGTTVYNTLVAAAQLGITAITAGPFAVIGLLVIALGLGSAITSLLGGILYAAGSAVGLYVSIAAAIGNECAPSTDTGGDTTNTGTTPVPTGGSGGSGSGSGSNFSPPPASKKGKKQPKPAVNCFNAQKQAGWMSSLQKSAFEASKHLIPFVFDGGDDSLLTLTEGILDATVTVAKNMQGTP